MGRGEGNGDGIRRRAYRRLARRLLPSDTDEQDLDDLVELRRALWRRQSTSRAGRFLFGLRMVADLLWTAVAVRIRTPAGGGPGSHRARRRARTAPAHALRSVVRRPGRTALTAFTVGLGVAAGTLVTVLVRDVVLQPLPYADTDELVRLVELDEDRRPWWPSRLNFQDWRAAGARSVSGMAGATIPQARPVLIGDRAVRSQVAEASQEFFGLLGARFAVGQGPSNEAWGGGGSPTAVVSHGFWTREMGRAAPGDGELLIGTERFPVVAVLAPDFGFLGDGGTWSSPDVWLPLERDSEAGERTNHGIHVVARLTSGTGLARARADLDAMAGAVAQAHGEPTHARFIGATSLADDMVGPAHQPLLLLLAGAAGVLLVACLNLAGTLLADGIRRRREMGLRQALGAGRGQISSQLVLEACFASLPGLALGVILAAGGLTAIRYLDPQALPRLHLARLDAETLAVATTAALAVAFVAACLPALLLASPRTMERSGLATSRGEGGRLRTVWNGMIAVQVALTVTLVMGSATLLDSLLGLLRSDLGFEAEGVVAIQASLPESRYGAAEARIRYIEEGLDALRRLPGVGAASVTHLLPHVTQAWISGTRDPNGDPEHWTWAGVRAVDSAYFDVLGIPVLQGAFPGDSGSAVVDRTVSERLLAGSAMGRQVRSGMTGGPVTVTGVVGPVREWGLDMDAIGTVYLDFRSAPGTLLEPWLLMRGEAGAAPPVAEARRALAALDPQVPLLVEPLERAMGRTLGARRLVLALTGAFTLLGLFFAALGIYGIVAYVAQRRTRDSGIRLALGARPGQIRRQAMAEGLVPTSVGLVLGLGLAVATVLAVGSRIQGVDGLGLAELFLAGAGVMVVATLAGWLPARRTTRLDVTRILQGE